MLVKDLRRKWSRWIPNKEYVFFFGEIQDSSYQLHYGGELSVKVLRESD